MVALEILIDLDDTLVHDHRVGKADFENILTLNYSFYLGGRELLAVLQQVGARLSIHSQGSKLRNTKLVSAMVAKYFAAEDPFQHRVFYSKEDAVRRKPLGGLFDGIDVERAIMLDDLSHLFAIKGEERNFLQVIPNLVAGAEKDLELKRHYQVVCSNRLVRALGIVLWALHITRTTRLSPAEALSAVQWYGGNGYRHLETHARAVYELGLKAMRRVNPGIEMKLDGDLAPWTFPFEKALRDNKFEPEQVEDISEKLPRLSEEEEKLLQLALDFDPEMLFAP